MATRKTTAKKTAAKPKHSKAEIEAAQNKAATAMDPQTGMDTVHAEKPSKAAIERQFAEADAKGSPEDVAREEATLSRQIRGY